MRKSLLIISVVVAVGVLLAVGIWMRGATLPAPEIVSEESEHPSEAGHYSARVGERLQQLREDYARHQEAAGTEATPPGTQPERHGGEVPAQAAAANAGTTQPDADLARGTREPWKNPAPAPAPAQTPNPDAQRRRSKLIRGPEYALPHPAYMNERPDMQQLEDTILNNPDREKRLDALVMLGGEAEGDAVRLLTLAMNDPDPEVRSEVIAALGDYPDAISPELLQPALHDNDPGGDPEPRHERAERIQQPRPGGGQVADLGDGGAERRHRQGFQRADRDFVQKRCGQFRRGKTVQKFHAGAQCVGTEQCAPFERQRHKAGDDQCQ